MKTFYWKAGLLCIFLLCSSLTLAQESTIYISILSTKLFVVGAANPQTGLFYKNLSGDTTWHHSGATNIRAFGLAVHTPSKGKLVYIASGNGAHRTTDGGQTWKVTTGWEITEVLWVSIDQENPDNVYIATAYGIFKTSDGGESWRKVNTGLNASFTSSVIVDVANPKTLYCSTEDGVYRSDDAAQTWKRTGLNVGGVRVLAQHPKNSQVLFVGTEDHGIYTTRNGGKYWVKSEAGIDHSTFYNITFDPQHPDTMYAGGYVTGVYKSVNGGQSWKRVHQGLTDLNVHSIAVDPKNSNRVFAGTIGGGLFQSDDAGETWRNVGFNGSQVWTISLQPF